MVLLWFWAQQPTCSPGLVLGSPQDVHAGWQEGESIQVTGLGLGSGT